MKRLLLGLAAAFASTVFADIVDLADVLGEGERSYTVTELSSGNDYTYSGESTVDLIFNVAENVEYSGSISGNIRLVKQGAGDLKITKANTYAGGTKIERGNLAVAHADAVGPGQVEVIAPSTDSAPSCLRIDEAMTFDNDILVTGGKSGTGGIAPGGDKLKARAAININTTAATTLSGDITALCDLYFWDANKNTTRTFSGKVAADGHHIMAAPYNSVYVFSGGVKAKVFYATYVYLHMNSVKFCDKPVEVEKMVVAYTKVQLYDVFGPGMVLRQDGSSDPVRTVVTLYDNITVGGWETPQKENENKLLYPIRCDSVSTPRTLTIKSSKSATSYGTLCDSVSLVYDPVSSACTQTLTSVAQRNHDTKGSLTVKRGTFKISGCVSLPKMVSIAVDDGATLLADTSGVGAFAAVANISVGAGASFYCADNMVEPFSPGIVKLELAADSAIGLPEGSLVSISQLWIDGVRIRGGRYSPDGANGTIALSQLKSGTVFVPDFAGTAETSVWTGDGDGFFESAGNWEGAKLPDWQSAGAELVFAAEGSASTSASVASELSVNRIVFRQPLGFTLAAADGGLVNLLGGVAFGDIGEAAPNYRLDVPVKIVGDQTWVLPENNASVFSITKPLVSDAEAGGEMLYITNRVGTLNFYMTNSTYLGSIYAQANTINIAGENVFGNAAKNGKVTLKLNHDNETAKCYFKGVAIDQQLVCNMADKNNYYIFECVAGATNIFRGYVQLPQWTRFCSGSYTVFENGVRVNGYNRQCLADNAVVVFRGDRVDYYNDGGNHGMAPVVEYGSVGARMVFECPIGIEAVENVDIAYALNIDLRYPYAFAAGKWSMDGIMHLNGYSQKATRFQKSYGTISSTNLPAFVELDLPAGQVETNSLKFVDLAGFKMSGAGVVRMNGISTSSGSFVVENGTVEMGTATWLNATNVVVGGEGTLRMSRGKVFSGRKASLRLSENGKIEIPSGENQRFDTVTAVIEGQEHKLEAGTYGADCDGVLAGRIVGGGTITVVGDSLRIILR